MNVYNTIHKIMGLDTRAVAMAMLPPPPTKPITLPYSVVLAGEKTKVEYTKPRT